KERHAAPSVLYVYVRSGKVLCNELGVYEIAYDSNGSEYDAFYDDMKKCFHVMVIFQKKGEGQVTALSVMPVSA
ncbi:MAG: hypothetical protein IKU76_05580, partial [Bacteroidaceae bacterium]|nr:hypothetical protein [Bacteroidaceae bacterium]